MLEALQKQPQQYLLHGVKAIFVDMPLNIITSIQDKVRDFTKPRMKYKEGRYQPATIEAVIPPAHKIKMFLKTKQRKNSCRWSGFLRSCSPIDSGK